MAKLASSNQTPAHERNRATAAKRAGAAIGLSSVTARQAQSQADTARAAIVTVMRAWVASTIVDPAMATVVAVNRFVCADFRTMKVSAKAAGRREWNRLAGLHTEKPSNPAPHGTLAETMRGASKGIRQRRRPLENFQEFLFINPMEAAASVEEKSQLSWTEKCILWATPKTERCESSRMQITVGIDSDGCIHALGENYKEAYTVQTRTLEDGTEEEFCEVTVGPKGATMNITVIISTRPSGEVYRQMRRVVVESRNLLSNARKFLTDVEDAQTPERFVIPTVGE